MPKPELEQANQWLAIRRNHTKVLTAICPGANQSAKFWPLDRFEEIGRRLIEQGESDLIVIGGPAERSIGNQLTAAWGNGINAAGQFSVMESAALLSRCKFLLGLDTGTTHLAAALGIPCIALYADRDPPGQWEPLGNNYVLLRHPVPCGCCGLKECPIPDHPCMTKITTESVWSAILQINTL